MMWRDVMPGYVHMIWCERRCDVDVMMLWCSCDMIWMMMYVMSTLLWCDAVMTLLMMLVMVWCSCYIYGYDDYVHQYVDAMLMWCWRDLWCREWCDVDVILMMKMMMMMTTMTMRMRMSCSWFCTDGNVMLMILVMMLMILMSMTCRSWWCVVHDLFILIGLMMSCWWEFNVDVVLFMFYLYW